MQKRKLLVITCIIGVLFGSSILYKVNSVPPIKAADHSDNQMKIDILNKVSSDQSTVVLTIDNTKKQSLTLQTEGIENLDEKTISEGIDSSFDGKIAVEKTESQNKKKLLIENGSKPLVLTFSVKKETMTKQGKVNLLGKNQEVLVEKIINFDESAVANLSTEHEALGISPVKESRGLTRDATTPPGESLPLMDVFRQPIGTGPIFLNDGKVLKITSDKSGGQKGAIWSQKKLNLKRDFHIKSYLFLGNKGGDAGDGITFTLQNDPRMTTSPTSVIGSSGMGIGAYYRSTSETAYVQRALSLEFDTYYNGGSSDKMDREVGVNNKMGHVAFVTPSTQNNNYTGQHHSWIFAPDFLSNGTWRTLDVIWDSVAKKLTYRLSGVGTDSYTISDLNTKFGGTEVYWGFTGSTGSKYAENAIAFTQLPGDVEQTAQIENLTQGLAPEETVNVKKDDTLKLKDTIIFDENSIMNAEKTKIRVNLAEGLTYKADSLELDGVKIPETSIQKVNNQLIISNLVFSRIGVPYELNLEATVSSGENDVQLESTFDYLSSDDEIVSSSNKVVAQIPLIKGIVTIHYVDEDKIGIAPVKIINQKVGTTYAEQPISIAEYFYDRTEGNPSGTVQETSQDVYFYYKKAKANLTVEFVDESGSKLHEPIVKEKAIDGTVDLTREQDIVDAIATVLGKRYLLEASGRPQNETAVLISKNGVKVTYKFQGTLSVYSGPKEINFGSHEVSWKGTKNAIPSYDLPLIIWDNRKTLDDWKLTVRLEDELSIPNSSNHVLNGVLSYQTKTDKKTLSVDAQEVLRTKHESSGQYNVSTKTWGPDKQGLRLDVPSGAVKTIGEYETTLIWRVEEVY